MKKTTFFLVVVAISNLFFNCNFKSEIQENATENPIKEEIVANTSTTFTIEGMTCEMGCAKTIEYKLSGLEGVTDAKVDFETKTATVSFDNQKQTTESITKTVEAVAGGDTYKVSDMKTESMQ